MTDYICEPCLGFHGGSGDTDSRAYEQRAVSAGVDCKPPRGLHIAAQQLQRGASTTLPVIANSSLKGPKAAVDRARETLELSANRESTSQ